MTNFQAGILLKAGFRHANALSGVVPPMIKEGKRGRAVVKSAELGLILEMEEETAIDGWQRVRRYFSSDAEKIVEQADWKKSFVGGWK